MSPLLQEVLKQVEQLAPEDQRELIRRVAERLEAVPIADRSSELPPQGDSPLGQKLRAIRARIVESSIPSFLPSYLSCIRSEIMTDTDRLVY